MKKSRKRAIEKILENVNQRDIVVSSVGMTSRELYGVKDRLLNFYMVSGMGTCLSVALGMALNTDRQVIAILGDGEALMGLGTFVTVNKLHPNNLEIYILDNGEHASTGGQKTSSDAVDFESLNSLVSVIKISSGKGNAPRIPYLGHEIKERFLKALKETK